ncbi:hypothetical protein IV203_021971 [Nitzschia inconspicua]|uniref:Uncharacterized protein n=1 Tax=Nitzschia inconspicua TaxID=303405 RepID=A0A9K3PDZ7_9STRA|nr:hypothetical protein IV203_021971 [Nitzschia inconspicua]
MGQQQSVQIQSEINHPAKSASRSVSATMTTQNLNGQKTSENNETNKEFTLKTTISTISSEGHDVVDDYDSTTITVASYEEDDFDTDDEEEEDEELEEFILERKMILQDARNLAIMADFYYSPEKPVAVDGTASARCYFDRVSAVGSETCEAQAERDLVLKEAAALKKLALDYLHPERPVQVSDATVCARSYFDRYSAPTSYTENKDEEAEYQKIMKDLKRLKVTATWYLHPEKAIECDGFAMGRNYYSRPSADENEGLDQEIERECILRDMALLKTTAEWYLKPELPVAVDATCFGRNYFSRPSAAEQSDADEDSLEEHDRIMQDLQALKMTAEWYLHPEKPVVTSDPTACGRNFFSRASAPEYEEEDTEERAMVLAEAARLKQVAQWYLRPEMPVITSDPTACARNYFTRASAQGMEEEDAEERSMVLAEAAQLKQVAEWYLHPEKPVVTSNPTACGRNFFSRASAPEYEEEDTEERAMVLVEAARLKQVAQWYLHPEKPVITSDPTACARNYFTRASAQGVEEEDAEERLMVLAEAARLKQVAEWYLHPEKPVVTSDPMACARNFFSRPSAMEQENEDILEERKLVLTEAKKLKDVAEWYHCPQKPVLSDGISSGRNYFNRQSAPEEDSDVEERDSILADAKALKQVAEWYYCPEMAVEVDSTACARNFFSRPTASEYESEETIEAQNTILADANKLKEVAGWYYHPETPVTSSIAVTRNYFTRPSAEEQIDVTDQEERKAILVDSMQLKKLAIDYLHPEIPVVSSINCARNYFNRPSAQGHTDHIHSEGHSINEHGYLHEHHMEHHNTNHKDYYHYHDYGYHHDDDHSHGAQSDHFEMDEDVHHNFHQSMVAHQEHQVQTVPIIKEEGNLSRSPSDVMLFDESAM